MLRKALVIGNKNYTDRPLITPINDANDIALTLTDKNFDVTVERDLDGESFERIILDFVNDIKVGRHVALFYFAGHGVQVQGKNYLLPVGNTFHDETHVKHRAYPLDELLERLEENKHNINIVILDACRDNPFSGQRSLGKSGLAEISVAKGSFIAFATSPGKTASDISIGGRNGLYTSHLLNALKVPELGLDERFKLVRENVYAESNEQQLPWVSNSVIGDFFFDTKNDKAKGFPTIFRDASNFEISECMANKETNKKFINVVTTWDELVLTLENMCQEGHSERPFCLDVMSGEGRMVPLLCLSGGGKVDYGFSLYTIETYLDECSEYGCFSNRDVLKIAKKAPDNSEIYYSIDRSERVTASELVSWPTILWGIHSTDRNNLGSLHASLINMVKDPSLKYPSLQQLIELISFMPKSHREAYVKIEITTIYEDENFEECKYTDDYILTGYCFIRKQFNGFDKRYNALPPKSEWLTYSGLLMILELIPSFQLKEKLQMNLVMGDLWDGSLSFEEHTFLLGHLGSKLIIPD